MGTLETRGSISILGRDGDTKVIWDVDNTDEVENARRTFNDLRRKGFTAYSVKGKDGERDRVLLEFDPTAGRIIMVPRVAGGVDGVDDDEDPLVVCSRRLGNLLAVIHRDGGQYITEHGLAKACADAEARVAMLNGLEDRLQPDESSR